MMAVSQKLLPGKTGVNKCGHRMDADGPGDGEVDQDLDPLGGRIPFLLRVQDGPADHDVQEEITVQDDHVPEKDRAGSGIKDHVEGPGRLPEVHDDEGEAHDHRGDGQEFPQDRDLAEGLVVVEVVGQNQHDRRRGHSDQEGELGDVERPGDVPAHAGDAQAVIQLAEVIGAPTHDEENRSPPRPSIFGLLASAKRLFSSIVFFLPYILTRCSKPGDASPAPACGGG